MCFIMIFSYIFFLFLAFIIYLSLESLFHLLSTGSILQSDAFMPCLCHCLYFPYVYIKTYIHRYVHTYENLLYIIKYQHLQGRTWHLLFWIRLFDFCMWQWFLVSFNFLKIISLKKMNKIVQSFHTLKSATNKAIPASTWRGQREGPSPLRCITGSTPIH